MNNVTLGRNRKERLIERLNWELGILASEPRVELVYWSPTNQEDIIWSIGTEQGDFWVVDSADLPLRLYRQEARALTPDEVYSLHIGTVIRSALRLAHPEPAC